MACLREAFVLAIDDDADMRELLSIILREHVREVVVAGSVAEAMRLLEIVRPTLIVSDLSMPQEDGYDMIRRIRSNGANRTTPAIALSAYAEDGCRDAALAAGFDMFLRKPLALGSFVTVLDALLHD